MFGIIKWGAIATFFAWVVASYGPMLGLSDNQILAVTTTADRVTAGAMTPEQQAQAQAALKQVTPTPEELQAKALALTPIVLGKIEEGKTALLEAAGQMRKEMAKQP